MTQSQLDKIRLELRRGVLVLAVLASLKEAHYGYSLRKQLNDNGIEIDEGTLYPLILEAATGEVAEADALGGAEMHASTSGLAVLSMPILAPVADFAGVKRELVVTAFATASGIVIRMAPVIIDESNERVRKPCAIVPPKGDAAAAARSRFLYCFGWTAAITLPTGSYSQPMPCPFRSG